jgi:murein DD-endopeptidase MepM/ murein hydrolase activator NlpD
MATTNGRHRRPQPPVAGVTLAKAAGATAAGAAALPVLTAGSAHAALASVWDRVAACESSGDWHINTGNGYYGGLQFAASTWAAYGGKHFADTAAQADREQQITVAQRVLQAQGPGAWPVCSVRAGLTRADGASTTAPVSAAKATARPAKPKKPGPPAGGAEYTVRAGDTLSGIAQQQRVPGGWESVYAANRTVVGADPDLIFPGERLTLGAAAAPVKPVPVVPAPARPAAAVHHTAPAHAPASHVVTGGFVAPISGNLVISETYGVPGPWAAGHHTGVDLAVPVGTPVHAVGAGTVVKAEWGGAYGRMVVIRHADGRYSLYAHLSRFEVQAGQDVAAGTEIALSGATGNVTGPHLHFEVDTTEQYGSDINPLTWLASHGVQL